MAIALYAIFYIHFVFNLSFNESKTVFVSVVFSIHSNQASLIGVVDSEE